MAVHSFNFPVMKPFDVVNMMDASNVPPMTQTDEVRFTASSYNEAMMMYEREKMRRRQEEKYKARYYQIPTDRYSHYTYGVDVGTFNPQPQSHRCLVADCKESHRDFHKGVLDYYKERHPEIAKKTECKNIMCHIEQIKRKI